MKFWKNDNFFIGFLASVLVTGITVLIVIYALPAFYGLILPEKPGNQLFLLSAIPGIILMRWYFKKLRFEKAGMGAIVVVFALILIYFLLIEGKSVTLFP